MSFEASLSPKRGHQTPPTIRDPHSKRMKVEAPPLPLSLIPIVNSEFEFTQSNTVHLSRYDFIILFEHPIENGKNITCRGLLGNHVFKVVQSDSVVPGTITINPIQNQEISGLTSTFFGSQHIQFHPFFWNNANTKHIKTINFQVTLGHDDSYVENPVHIKKETLRKFVSETHAGNHFKNGQRIQINFGTIALVLQVTEMVFKEQTQIGEMPFGYLRRDSKIKLTTEKISKVLFTKQIDQDQVDSYYFRIFLKSKSLIKSKIGNLPRQCIINDELLKSEIARKIGDEKIEIGHKLTISTLQNPDCVASFDSVKFLKKSKRFDIQSNKTPLFSIDFSKIVFSPTPEIILTLQEKEPPLAQQATFTIISATVFNTYDGSHQNYIPVDELTNCIQERAVTSNFVISQILNFTLTTGEYSVEVTSLASTDLTDLQLKNTRRIRWKIDPHTSLYLKMKESLHLNFVDHSSPNPIEELLFLVKLPTFSTGKVTLPFPTPKKTVLINETDLNRVLHDVLPPTFLKEDSWESFLKDGQSVQFSIKSWSFADKSVPKPSHQLIGKITPQTKINFTTERNGGITITRDFNVVSYDAAKQRIREMGLGGMNQEFEKVFRDILSSRSKFGEFKKQLGINPPRGILLYGPPGTGKTTLAKNIGKVLGCDGEQFITIGGPTIWDKWVGESEQKVRDLFAPARTSWNKYKEESPLFIIAIDEIDGIFSKRDGSSKRWETNVVNQFLEEMDGLDAIHNILVIGMTNHLELIDPAFRRAGRFDTEVELKYPQTIDKRKEIFQIHMKKVYEMNLVSPDVDLNELAILTDGFSGADIEGLIRKATSYPIERLSTKDKVPEQLVADIEVLKNDPDSKLSMKDLRQALTEIKGTKGPEKGISAHMYT